MAKGVYDGGDVHFGTASVALQHIHDIMDRYSSIDVLAYYENEAQAMEELIINIAATLAVCLDEGLIEE